MIHCNNQTRTIRRTGLGVVEVIVLVALFGIFVLFVLMALPRGRETARMASCQRNLMQLGVAAQLYEQVNRRYPAVPHLGSSVSTGAAPIDAMLQALTIPDFLELADASRPPKPRQAPARGAKVAGLLCPSDANATGSVVSTALSYRANVGDGTDGSNGPFSPGREIKSAIVEAADGLSFTAGFGERLLGSGRDAEPGPMNYVEVPGAVNLPCNPLTGPDPHWRGDAGSSWSDPTWRSALYNHATSPNAAMTCVAVDGKTATMSASSSHPGRINVWMLDGSLRGVTPTIAPSIWKAMGSIGTPSLLSSESAP